VIATITPTLVQFQRVSPIRIAPSLAPRSMNDLVAEPTNRVSSNNGSTSCLRDYGVQFIVATRSADMDQ